MESKELNVVSSSHCQKLPTQCSSLEPVGRKGRKGGRELGLGLKSLPPGPRNHCHGERQAGDRKHGVGAKFLHYVRNGK